MSLGQMNRTATIKTTTITKDAQGFATRTETTVATVRCYREGQHGTEKWANMAAFSEATDLFRFRKIPNVTIAVGQLLLCDGQKYTITSVEDVRGYGMYLEVLAKREVVAVSG